MCEYAVCNFCSSRRRHTSCALVTGVQTCALPILPGIGPKTASWIVRNRRASDHVAILDVHIVRACSAIGVFPEGAQPARRYADLEQRFLAFCEATQSRASAMDAVMWSTMRSLSRGLLQQLEIGRAHV